MTPAEPPPATAAVPGVVRDQFGRWMPGFSANPGGRNKSLARALRETITARAGLAGPGEVDNWYATRLFEIADDLEHDQQFEALKLIGDRLYGKPVQLTTIDGGEEARVHINLLAVIADPMRRQKILELTEAVLMMQPKNDDGKRETAPS